MTTFEAQCVAYFGHRRVSTRRNPKSRPRRRHAFESRKGYETSSKRGPSSREGISLLNPPTRGPLQKYITLGTFGMFVYRTLWLSPHVCHEAYQKATAEPVSSFDRWSRVNRGVKPQSNPVLPVTIVNTMYLEARKPKGYQQGHGIAKSFAASLVPVRFRPFGSVSKTSA